MEEKFIHAKHLKGYIAVAVVSPSLNGWVADFIENEKNEKGKTIRHRLTLQRGNRREFKSLDAAANTLERMGFTQFMANLQ